MRHLHEDDLELYLLGRVPEEEAAAIESHVMRCQACDAKLNEAITFIRHLAGAGRTQGSSGSGEKRREARNPTDAPADIRVFSPLRSEQVEVRVLNASKGGLMLQTTKFFEAGALVELRLSNSVALGEVRYCFRVENGFHAGVQILEQRSRAGGREARGSGAI